MLGLAAGFGGVTAPTFSSLVVLERDAKLLILTLATRYIAISNSILFVPPKLIFNLVFIYPSFPYPYRSSISLNNSRIPLVVVLI